MADRRQCAGPGCGNAFKAQRSTALYCGTTCRSRAARARKAAESAAEIDVETEAAEKEGDAEHQLVSVTRRELQDAGVLDTVNGQLALNLARKLVDVEAKGVSALTKELRAILAEAKTAQPAPVVEAEPEAEPPSSLDQARNRREAKARQAADRT